MGPSSAHRLGDGILLRLDMQSDGSPHFLRVPQERPIYHSTSSPNTSCSPYEDIGTEARIFRDWVIREYTKSHGRLANARKATTPRTSAGASGADAQELHHARRVAAVERRACVPTEARAARGGGCRSVGCELRGPQRKRRLTQRQPTVRPDLFATPLSHNTH